MLFNYLIVAWRNLTHHRGTTLINITGLSLAISCCTVFFHILTHELSFDHWHAKAGRIYMVTIEKKDGTKRSQVHYPAAEALRQDFPDFEMITKTHGPEEYKISIERNDRRDHFNEPLVLFADSYFLQMFDFNPLTSFDYSILDKPGQALLTESLATKFFGTEEPLGKLLYISDTIPVQVAGILANPPRNTNFQFNIIVSTPTSDKLQKDPKKVNDWLFSSGASVYACLSAGDAPEKYNTRLEDFTKRHAAFYNPGDYYYRLYPIKKFHTNSSFEWDFIHYTPPPELIWVPAVLAILLLSIASFNFINLTTAQTMLRAREVGIRTVAGSTRFQLTVRFIIEIALVISVASGISLFLSYTLLPKVNNLFAIAHYQLALNTQTFFFLIVLGIVLVMVTGIYPVMIMLRLKPQEALKSKVYAGRGHVNNLIRKTLIIIQLSGSFLLLTASLVISAQISLWENTDMQFRRNKIAMVYLPETSLDQYRNFKTKLTRIPGVENVSITNSPPTGGWWGSAKILEEDQELSASSIFMDDDYHKVYHMKLLAGRINPTGEPKKVIINRKLVTALGFDSLEEAINQEIIIDIAFKEKFKAPVYAVLEDNFNNPMQNFAKPKIYILNHKPKNISLHAHVALSTDYSAVMNLVEKEFKSTFPNELFEWGTIEENVADDYLMETLIKKAVRFGTAVALIIAAIGLYGIISFMGTVRQKEMGIRKVNGATSANIMAIYVKEFIVLVMISFALTTPIAVWLINEWLEQYVNRIESMPGIFILALVFIIFITTTSVLYRAIQLAQVNPVEILKKDI
jgi:putative ABC transport system permease protein